MTHCTMGVGCDEYGVCYADAHDAPLRCPQYRPTYLVMTNAVADRFVAITT